MPLAYWCHAESTYYNSFGVAYNNLVFALWPKRGTFSNVVSSAKTPWNDRVVLYLKDCGITDAEIAAFRGIMLP